MTSTSSRLTGKVHNISPPQPSDADPETELIAKVWDPILDLHGLNAPITTSSMLENSGNSDTWLVLFCIACGCSARYIYMIYYVVVQMYIIIATVKYRYYRYSPTIKPTGRTGPYTPKYWHSSTPAVKPLHSCTTAQSILRGSDTEDRLSHWSLPWHRMTRISFQNWSGRPVHVDMDIGFRPAKFQKPFNRYNRGRW